MPDCLIEWLKPWKDSIGRVHPYPAPYDIQIDSELVTTKLGKLIGGWKANALRSSSVSYQLAISRNIDDVALSHGHTKQVSTGEYLNPRFKTDARLWYSLTPEKVKDLIENSVVDINGAS